jgi:hypothetical protein
MTGENSNHTNPPFTSLTSIQQPLPSSSIDVSFFCEEEEQSMSEVATPKDAHEVERLHSEIIAWLAHCLTKIFLSPLRVDIFPRLCSGLSSKTATSLICLGAGEAQGIR